MLIGDDWSQTIDRELREADFVVVLLTNHSSRSEGVLGEMERARRSFAENGKPRILPVRLAYTGQLPYSLGLILDPLQYSLWRGRTESGRIVEELLRAMGGGALPSPDLGSPQTQDSTPPAYAAMIPPPGGTLDVDDPLYIEQAVAKTAFAHVRKPPPELTVVLKAPRQMGKSSLLVRLVAAAMRSGKRAVLLDLQILGHLITDESQLYRRFAAMIAEQLELPANADTFWDSKTPEPLNCTRFLQQQILPYTNPSVLLAIDEAERLIDSPFREDFYGMLRSWHNLRGNPITPVWKKLGLVLVISTEPAFLIEGVQSPFNVVDPISLNPFTLADVSHLNRLHGSPLTSAEVTRLHHLVGGQPYLIRKALYEVGGAYGSLTPNQLFDSAVTENGPFRDHLRRFLLKLEELPEIKAALAAVVRGVTPKDIRLVYRLQSAGLATVMDGQARPSCELYETFFQRLRI